MIRASAHIMDSIEVAGDLIAKEGDGHSEIVIVAGSGLDYIGELVSVEARIPYADIPGFPLTRVQGHSGTLLLGRWNRLRVAVLCGRGHYYEGYSMAEVAHPIRTLAWLGARTLLVTSAVGGVTSEFVPGTLTIVRDHINLVQSNPLIGLNNEGLGPRYVDLLHAYSLDLRLKVQEQLKRRTGKTLPEVVLAFVSGPCFETKAELHWLKIIDADVVGWSLVPEVIAAVHAGMDVLALALVTDFSDPSRVERISADEIFQVGPSCKDKHLPVFETALAVIESSLMREGAG